MSRVAGPVRLRRCESVVDGCGLTFIALQNDYAKALKINPHRQLRFNQRLRADWAETRMGRGPVRVGSIDCDGARCGLTLIAKLIRHLRKTSSILKVDPQLPHRFTEGSGRIGRCWTRLSYPDTVFAYPPCQACNSPTARPRQVYRGALEPIS